MASFNKVFLMGNLTRDPELKYLPSGGAVAAFGLACNRKYKTGTGEEREDVLFVDVTFFGKQAEVVNQYCQKGKPLFVEGRLKLDQWDDKQTGQKRSKLSVVGENFQFLGGPKDGGGGDGGGQPYPRTRQSVTSAPKGDAPFGDETVFKDEDVPFRWEGRRQQQV